MEKRNSEKPPGQYLGWQTRIGQRIRDDIDIKEYRKLNLSVLESSEELEDFKNKTERSRKTYSDVITKKMAVLIALGKVVPSSTEEQNRENMLIAQNMNTGGRYYEEVFEMMPYFFRDHYEYNTENIEYAVHKVGQTLKRSMIYKAKIIGTELVEVGVPNPRVVDLAARNISVDFRECRSRDMQWSEDPFLRTLFYRVLILDTKEGRSPLVGIAD